MRSLGCALIALGAAASGPAAAAKDTAPSVSILVQPAPMHGVNGLSVGPDGMIYGASFVGRSIYRIDPKNGHVTVVVDGAQGDPSDDIAVRADGLMAWTSPPTGKLWLKWPGGAPLEAVRNLPSLNPVVWGPDGRLFFGQIGEADTIWSLDPATESAPHLVMNHAGHLNGFAFGPDGRLYAPLWERDAIVAVDITAGTESPIASQLGMSAAVKVDRQGRRISVDWLKGDVRRTDPATGQSRIIATVTPPLDNLALGPNGTIYVANPADSTVTAIDPKSGKLHVLVAGHFSAAGGLTRTIVDGRPALLVADPLAYHAVDIATGKVTRPYWTQGVGASHDIIADDHFIVVSHQSQGRIQKIARTGDGLTGKPVGDFRQLKTPTGLALLDNGDIIAADYATGQLVRLNDSGMNIIAENLAGPVSLLLLSQSEILVSEAAGGVVSRIDTGSGKRAVVAHGLSQPEGMALLKDGRLAVVEKGKKRVVAMTLDDTGSPVILADRLPFGAGIALTIPALGMPTGLAADIAGNLYIACDGDNSVRKIALP